MSNAYKEVGTMKEIGAQVGDVVALVKWGEKWDEFNSFSREKQYTVGHDCIYSGNGYLMLRDCGDDKHFRIISRANQAQTGPVRTVTRHEIVPGVYGRVAIGRAAGGTVPLGLIDDSGDFDLAARLDADELTAAIATLTAIRDAMQANTTA